MRSEHSDEQSAEQLQEVDHPKERIAHRGICASPDAIFGSHSEQSAQLIDHLKKADMAKEAERLLGGTGWLLEPLRTPDVQAAATDGAGEAGATTLPAFLAEGDDGAGDPTASDPEEPQPHVVAE